MSLEKLVNHLIEAARKEERVDKPMRLHEFKFERTAKSLTGPAKECGVHHRKREKYYTEELEKAEKKLREDGIKIEVVDEIGTLQFTHVASGNLMGASAQFQPKIDQTMLDKVKRAKSKMLEHRAKADQYEKIARAFACAPNGRIELTVEDTHFFRLEA